MNSGWYSSSIDRWQWLSDWSIPLTGDSLQFSRSSSSELRVTNCSAYFHWIPLGSVFRVRLTLNSLAAEDPVVPRSSLAFTAGGTGTIRSWTALVEGTRAAWVRAGLLVGGLLRWDQGAVLLALAYLRRGGFIDSGSRSASTAVRFLRWWKGSFWEREWAWSKFLRFVFVLVSWF